MENEPGSLTHKLSKFLLAYRSAPHALTNETPAKLFLNRELRTKLSLLQPDHEDQVMKKHEKMHETHGGRQHKPMEVGQNVLCKNFTKGGKTWVNGKIIAKPGILTYVVQIGPNKFAKRHFDQLVAISAGTGQNLDYSENSINIPDDDLNLPVESPTNTQSDNDTANSSVPSGGEDIMIDPNDNNDVTNTSSQPEQTDEVRRYPTRTRNPPLRLRDYNTEQEGEESE